MPELPDVENYARYLKRTALHKKISGVEVGRARIVRGSSARKLARTLKGNRFKRARRHGKHLLVALDRKGWLDIHFGMTGRLAYFKHMQDDPKYDRLRLDFANGYHLAFESQRLLGGVRLLDDADAFIKDKQLGPDALAPSFRAEDFAERLSGRSGQIKSALMDQSLIAGIGNVYSDEVLFQAKLHPRQPVKSLDRKELGKLFRAMRRVLKMAISHGAGTDDVANKIPKSYLLAHRKKGAACPRCGGRIATLKAGGRTAYYCPRCQKLSK